LDLVIVFVRSDIDTCPQDFDGQAGASFDFPSAVKIGEIKAK